MHTRPYRGKDGKNLVIVSHCLNEAITRCILANKHKKNILEANITIISLQELLSDYEIFDEVSDAGTTIQWMKGAKLPITNASHLLLNRVLYIPCDLFIHFKKSDREYAQREFEAYIGFSFNAFKGVGNHLANGVSVQGLSLPQQWNRISKEKNMTISVPNYYWGPQLYNPLDNKNSLVYSKIFNFLDWSLSKNPQEEKQVFCFEKPTGEPVFILSIGNKQLVTTHICLSTELQAKITHLAARMNVFFDHFISEILLFIDGEQLQFGCINPEIIRSVKNEHFDDFVCNHLLSEFFLCL